MLNVAYRGLSETEPTVPIDNNSARDLQLIARLASLMVAALKAPLPDGAQLAAFGAVLGDASEADENRGGNLEAPPASYQHMLHGTAWAYFILQK